MSQGAGQGMADSQLADSHASPMPSCAHSEAAGERLRDCAVFTGVAESGGARCDRDGAPGSILGWSRISVRHFDWARQRQRGALEQPQTKHFASVTDPGKIGDLLRAMYSFAVPVTLAASKLALMLFVRPGELRKARWADLNLNAAEWRFTASKTGTPLKHQISIEATPASYRSRTKFLQMPRPKAGPSS